MPWLEHKGIHSAAWLNASPPRAPPAGGTFSALSGDAGEGRAGWGEVGRGS